MSFLSRRTRRTALAAGAWLVAGIVPAWGQPALYPDLEFQSGLGSLADVAISPDGRLIAAVGAGGGVGLWDAQTGTPIRILPADRRSLTRVVFGPQGNLLAVAGSDGSARIIDLRTWEQRDGARHAKAITALAFSPDGQFVASGDETGRIVISGSDGRGPVGELADEGHKKEILFLGFAKPGGLISLDKVLRVIAWDVLARRAVRRGTLQFETYGRAAVPVVASLEAGGNVLTISSQYTSASRAVFSSGGMARPDDIKRVNVLVPYDVVTGVSGAAIPSGDSLAEHLALAPGACFAFFTASAKGASNLNVWGLLERGDAVVRLALASRATAVVLDPSGRRLAIASEAGSIRTLKVSGATEQDCEAARRKASTPSSGEARISLGSETQPLIPAGAGYRIAVLRFEAGGVEAYIAESVRDMIMGEMANSRHVVVVERSAIDGILKEMEIQRSGLTAADAARIGRGLNARKVVFGSVSRFGEKTFVVSARVVDVETQQVEGTRQVTCENCGEKDLPRAVSTLRQAIVP